MKLRVLSLRDPAVRPRTGAALRGYRRSALAGGRQGPPLRATRPYKMNAI